MAAQSSDSDAAAAPTGRVAAPTPPPPASETPVSVLTTSGLTTPHTATFTASSASANMALTSAGVLGLAVVVMSLGVTIDVMTAEGIGYGVKLAFLASCLGMALRLRVRAVLTAVIAAPLLFAGAAIAIAKFSGEAEGIRQLGLDVATSLALSAPVLFAGTAVTVVVAVARLLAQLVRR